MMVAVFCDGGLYLVMMAVFCDGGCIVFVAVL